jgi:hypothetical protein
MSIADYRIYASPPSATKRMQKEFSNLAVSPFVLDPLEEIVTPRQNKEIDKKEELEVLSDSAKQASVQDYKLAYGE